MEGGFPSRYKNNPRQSNAFCYVARGREERNFRMEIVPNPFGGVNTHLWRNDAYIVGIAPVCSPRLYSKRKKEEGQERTGFLVEFSGSRENRAFYQQKIQNHDETED